MKVSIEYRKATGGIRRGLSSNSCLFIMGNNLCHSGVYAGGLELCDGQL